ncbi:MAG: hypothetical protein WC438_00760 [Candidatus Pacearchaeota archaeon]
MNKPRRNLLLRIFTRQKTDIPGESYPKFETYHAEPFSKPLKIIGHCGTMISEDYCPVARKILEHFEYGPEVDAQVGIDPISEEVEAIFAENKRVIYRRDLQLIGATNHFNPDDPAKQKIYGLV